MASANMHFELTAVPACGVVMQELGTEIKPIPREIDRSLYCI